jgi:hypothetical protein
MNWRERLLDSSRNRDDAREFMYVHGIKCRLEKYSGTPYHRLKALLVHLY